MFRSSELFDIHALGSCQETTVRQNDQDEAVRRDKGCYIGLPYVQD
jgi:hypothetical protein